MKRVFVFLLLSLSLTSIAVSQDAFMQETTNFRFDPLKKSNFYIKDNQLKINLYHKNPALSGKFSIPSTLLYRYVYTDSNRLAGNLQPLVMARPQDFEYVADICLKAKADCKEHYKMWKASMFGTLFFTAVSPIASLSVAIPASLTPPRIENLGLSDVDMLQEGIYFHTYRKEAAKLKSKRIWTAYGIGLGIHIGAIVGILTAFN